MTTSSLSEVAALDKLIDLLKGANGHQQLTQLVAENLLAFDQKFWIRLATRSDAAQNKAEKDTLTDLANVSNPTESEHMHCMHQHLEAVCASQTSSVSKFGNGKVTPCYFDCSYDAVVWRMVISGTRFIVCAHRQ